MLQPNNLKRVLEERNITIYALRRQMGFGPTQNLYNFRDNKSDLRAQTVIEIARAINELAPDRPVTVSDILPL